MSVHEQQRTQDAALAEEMKAHHAVMVAELDRLSAEFAAAAGTEPTATRQALAEWIEHVLVPHAEEEEVTTYPAAGWLPEGRLLIEAMLAEHMLIRRLAGLFATAPDAAEAAAYGRAVFEVFDSHQRKENNLILPLLVAADSVSLTEVMATAEGHHAGGHHAEGHRHHHGH